MCKYGWLVCAISSVGIFGSLSPWIYYPRIDAVVNGYQGDGWVLAFLFLLTIIFAIIGLKPKKYKRNILFISFIFNILITILVYNKIDVFNEEKLNFNSEDPYLITAAAGSHIAYGLYVVGISSLLNAIALVISFIQKMRHGNK